MKQTFDIDKVLGPRLIVRFKDETLDDSKTENGVFLPSEEAKKEMYPYDVGEVLKVGQGAAEFGIKVGNNVLVSKMAARFPINYIKKEDGTEYRDWIMIDGEVSAILN